MSGPGHPSDAPTPRRWPRLVLRASVGFVAFLVIGNGLILGSTLWFRWTSPAAAASLEQIAFSLETADGSYDRPGVGVTIASRVLDGPRRIWHNLT